MFNPLPKAIELGYDRARIWALTCLLTELMLFSVHCTVYLATVTSSTLVRSELMRFIVLPQRWLHLRTGECVGRGTYINICLNYACNSQKKEETRTNSSVREFVSFLPSPKSPCSALSGYIPAV